MSEKRAARELVKWVGVTLAVLLGLYVGAYYWTVRPEIFDNYPDPGMRVEPWYSFVDPFLADDDPYPDANPWFERTRSFFGPIHQLDRRIRPDIWELPPDERL